MVNTAAKIISGEKTRDERLTCVTRFQLQSCQQEIELDERGKLFRVPGLCVRNKGRKRKSRRTRSEFHWEHIPLHAMATRPRKQFHLYPPPSNPSSNLPFDFLFLSLSLVISVANFVRPFQITFSRERRASSADFSTRHLRSPAANNDRHR